MTAKSAVLLAAIVTCLLLLRGTQIQAQEVQATPTPSQSVRLTMIVTDAAKHSVDDIRPFLFSTYSQL
jgi:hypothetical protein